MLSDDLSLANAEQRKRKFSATERACAFAVHLFTASGAALALLALVAATQGDWSSMFWLLGIALALDAVDGPLARRFSVAERLPHWSGDQLDFVIDYVTYVFLPGYAIAASGLLPETAAVPLGALIVTTGALYFADRRMKMPDNYFRGFPVLWNAAAFYLFLLKPPPWTSAVAVTALVILTFVPFRFIHPVRVARWRAANLFLLGLWGFLAAAALLQDLAPQPWITAALCALGLYFTLVGLLPSARH
jgi:phosphatidylcholine synthase